MRNLTIATVAFSAAILVATCDIKSAKEFARIIFLEPEPGLSRPDLRRPEGVFIKPEGVPFSPERR